MDNKKTFKVLCLHGYRQDGKAFQAKSGGFRKIVKGDFSFVFIDAPHIVPKGDQNPEEDKTCRSWWFTNEDPLCFSSKHDSDFIRGFPKAFDKVCKAFDEEGPFDGIMGFSQGASLLSLICAYRQLDGFPHDFKFAIFVSGFRSLTTAHKIIYDKLLSASGKIRMPTMHIIGENDKVINSSVSQAMADDLFEDPFIVLHPNGHTVPSQTALKPRYLEFINSLKLRLSDS